MPNTADLARQIAYSAGRDEDEVLLYQRRLREVGLISQKGSGRGAALASVDDAVMLILGLLYSENANRAPEAIKNAPRELIRDLGRQIKLRIAIDYENLPQDQTIEWVTVNRMNGAARVHFEDRSTRDYGKGFDHQLRFAVTAALAGNVIGDVAYSLKHNVTGGFRDGGAKAKQAEIEAARRKAESEEE